METNIKTTNNKNINQATCCLKYLFSLKQMSRTDTIHKSWLTNGWFNWKRVVCSQLECGDHSATCHFMDACINICSCVGHDVGAPGLNRPLDTNTRVVAQPVYFLFWSNIIVVI